MVRDSKVEEKTAKVIQERSEEQKTLDNVYPENQQKKEIQEGAQLRQTQLSSGSKI